MLTRDILVQNALLSGLTDEQLDAIAAMSKNDEDAIFSNKYKQWRDEIDQVVTSVTGNSKSATTKTSDFLKSELQGMKDSLGQINTLKAENADLKKKIKSGDGDQALKSQIQTLETTIAAKEQQINDLTKAKTTIETDYQNQLNTLKRQNEETMLEGIFRSGLTGKKFKPGIDDDTAKMVIDTQIRNILDTTTRDEIVGTDGNKRTIFKNLDGTIIGDPTNNMAPITGDALLLQRVKGILDEGQTVQGAGSGGTNPPPVSGVDISGSTSRVEASRKIDDHLFSKGISTTSESYQDERNKIEQELGDQYTSLPAGIF